MRETRDPSKIKLDTKLKSLKAPFTSWVRCALEKLQDTKAGTQAWERSIGAHVFKLDKSSDEYKQAVELLYAGPQKVDRGLALGAPKIR